VVGALPVPASMGDHGGSPLRRDRNPGPSRMWGGAGP